MNDDKSDRTTVLGVYKICPWLAVVLVLLMWAVLVLFGKVHAEEATPPTSTIASISGPAVVGDGSTTTTIEGERETCFEVQPGVGQTQWGLQPCDWFGIAPPSPAGAPLVMRLPSTGGPVRIVMLALGFLLVGLGAVGIGSRRRWTDDR